MKKIPVFIFILGSLLLFSCKTNRNIEKPKKLRPKSAKFLMKRLVQNQVNAEWLSSKAKVTYRDDYGVQRFTANLRFRKDSLIWLNFKKLSVEAVRLQITPDSIYIINRLDNEYIIESFDVARRKFGLPANFEGLQSIVLGNPVFFTTDLDSEIDKDRYKLEGKTDQYETKYWLDGTDYLLSQILIEDYRNNRSMDADFGDYHEISAGQNFSYFRHLNLNSREFGEMSVKIELSKMEINVPKNIRFEIPDRYKRVSP